LRCVVVMCMVYVRWFADRYEQQGPRRA
jgi:hypothetical protein